MPKPNDPPAADVHGWNIAGIARQIFDEMRTDGCADTDALDDYLRGPMESVRSRETDKPVLLEVEAAVRREVDRLFEAHEAADDTPPTPAVCHLFLQTEKLEVTAAAMMIVELTDPAEERRYCSTRTFLDELRLAMSAWLNEQGAEEAEDILEQTSRCLNIGDVASLLSDADLQAVAYKMPAVKRLEIIQCGSYDGCIDWDTELYDTASLTRG